MTVVAVFAVAVLVVALLVYGGPAVLQCMHYTYYGIGLTFDTLLEPPLLPLPPLMAIKRGSLSFPLAHSSAVRAASPEGQSG